MLLGAIIGLLILFSSSIYRSLWSTGETVGGLRSLTIGSQYSLQTLLYLIVTQANILVPKIFENNMAVCIVVLTEMSYLLIRKSHSRGAGIRILLAVINILFIAYFLFHHVYASEIYILGKFTSLLINGAYFCIVTIEIIILFVDNGKYLCKLLTFWISIPAVVAPLVVTSETASRLFLTPYVFGTLLAVSLFVNILTQRPTKEIPIIISTCLVAVCIFFSYYGNVYHTIGICKRQRDTLMEKAVYSKAEEVILPKYPYKNFIWVTEPIGIRINYFREFYGLPPNMNISFQEMSN